MTSELELKGRWVTWLTLEHPLSINARGSMVGTKFLMCSNPYKSGSDASSATMRSFGE